MAPSSRYAIATLLVAFATGGMLFPLLHVRGAPPVDPSKPLPLETRRRGTYVNAGSRDVGPDVKRQGSRDSGL